MYIYVYIEFRATCVNTLRCRSLQIQYTCIKLLQCIIIFVYLAMHAGKSEGMAKETRGLTFMLQSARKPTNRGRYETKTRPANKQRTSTRYTLYTNRIFPHIRLVAPKKPRDICKSRKCGGMTIHARAVRGETFEETPEILTNGERLSIWWESQIFFVRHTLFFTLGKDSVVLCKTRKTRW